MKMNYELTKNLAKLIIDNPLNYKWSYQGLGMLRLYISNKFRMHIWCPSKAVKNVSVLHTHPWDLTSYVIAGSIKNLMYKRTHPTKADPFWQSTIKCGKGGGLVEGSRLMVYLSKASVDIIKNGNSYSQKADQIHESIPEEGTVTIIDRTFKNDTEHALVFWRYPGEWVSAEPRKATEKEINFFCGKAKNLL